MLPILFTLNKYLVAEESAWLHVTLDESRPDRGSAGCTSDTLPSIYTSGTIPVEISTWFDEVYTGLVSRLIVNAVDLERCPWKCFLFIVWKNLVMRLGVRRRHFECVYDLLGELFPLFINECRTRLSILLAFTSWQSMMNYLWTQALVLYTKATFLSIQKLYKSCSTLLNKLMWRKKSMCNFILNN